jgi:peptide/nickel transport system substrate-binding protein
MHSRRRFLSLSAASFLALTGGSTLLTACSDDHGGHSGTAKHGSGTPLRGGNLTFLEPTSPINWDPHVGTEDLLGLVLRPVFDSLVAEQADGTFQPWLATAWQVSADGLTYTFDLRDDVTFSDGAAFDAHAVKANFEHVVAPATESRYAKSLLGPYKATEVLGDHKVAVHLTAKYPQFLHAVAQTFLGFHSPASLKRKAEDLAAGGKAVVSTGAYTFESSVTGQKAVFKRREDYAWAPGSKGAGKDTAAKGPYLDGYTVLFVLKDQTRVGTVTSGQADIADQVPANLLAGLRGRSGVRLVSHEVAGSPYTYYLNTRRPLLKSVEARQVILYGVDVAAITKGVFQGEYGRAASVLSPVTRGYDPDLASAWGYDKAKAVKLLEGLGYTGTDSAGYRTKDGKRFRLEFPFATANTTDERRSFDLGLQDALKSIGVQLVLTELDANTYIAKEKNGDYDVSGLAWNGSDPSLLRNLFWSKSLLSTGGANKSWVDDPVLDGWLNAAEDTDDTARQNALYRKVQARVIEQAYALPGYVAKRSLAVRDDVRGIAFDAFGWFGLDGIWLDKA